MRAISKTTGFKCKFPIDYDIYEKKIIQEFFGFDSIIIDNHFVFLFLFSILNVGDRELTSKVQACQFFYFLTVLFSHYFLTVLSYFCAVC